MRRDRSVAPMRGCPFEQAHAVRRALVPRARLTALSRASRSLVMSDRDERRAGCWRAREGLPRVRCGGCDGLVRASAPRDLAPARCRCARNETRRACRGLYGRRGLVSQAAGWAVRGPVDGREGRASVRRRGPGRKDSHHRSDGPAAPHLTESACIGSGLRVVAHLQAIEGDEVDLNAEAWATTRRPDPLRGASGKLPARGQVATYPSTRNTNRSAVMTTMAAASPHSRNSRDSCGGE